ncbi:hypothetical protein [Streptomyces sp. NPDC029674]|uniref:hypothetical protein n=1 Tax=Streptomyces sp. NPDC029674 TaxID=3365297 RepID=UPI00384E39FB
MGRGGAAAVHVARIEQRADVPAGCAGVSGTGGRRSWQSRRSAGDPPVLLFDEPLNGLAVIVAVAVVCRRDA